MRTRTLWSTVFIVWLVPVCADAQDELVRTSESDHAPGIRITEPESGARFASGETVRVRYEARPGIKGRYVQVEFNEVSSVILETMEGEHEVEAPEPGAYEICARLLNPARAQLGVETCIDMVVFSGGDEDRAP